MPFMETGRMEKAVGAHPASSLLPPSSKPLSLIEPVPAFARPRSSRSATTSHYRPFSTTYPRPSTADGSLNRHRTSVFGNMVFNKTTKDSESASPRSDSPTQRSRKDSDGPSRFKLLKSKRSLVSLFHSGTNIAIPSPDGSDTNFSVRDIIPSKLGKTSSESSSSSSSGSSASSSSLPTTPTDEKSPMRVKFEHDPKVDTHEDVKEERVFVPKNTWFQNKFKARLHPYQDEAPYMRSFEPMDLENDRYTDLLYRRLYPKGSPTFHEFEKIPEVVLDVGCGSGHWMQYAAEKWPKSYFTGFDMVDTVIPAVKESGRIVIFRGNFVQYKWPFPSRTFDLVRISDVALAVPYRSWGHIVEEMYRVLRPDGRIEIVEDQLFFPFADEPAMPLPRSVTCSSATMAQRRKKGESFFDIDEESEEESDAASDVFDDNSVGSHSSSEPSTSGESPSTSPDEQKSILSSAAPPHRRPPPPTRPIPPIPEQIEPEPPSLPTAQSPSSWRTRMGNAKDLESMFERMLADRYALHPRPGQFLQRLLTGYFGSENCTRRSVHLKIAPLELTTYGVALPQVIGDSGTDEDEEWQTQSTTPVVISAPPAPKRKWMQKIKDRKESSETEQRSSTETCSSSDSVIPPNTSAKAIKRLVGDEPAPNQRSRPPRFRSISSSASSRSSLEHSTQPGGLVLWPRTFLPMSAAELEMHASKHIHTLIGCKNALAEYVTGFRDEHGEPYVSDDEFIDSLWDYEQFRRARFNWPSELPSSKTPPITEPFVIPFTPRASAFPGRKPVTSEQPFEPVEGPFGWDDLKHVRTIRVFTIHKTNDSDPSKRLRQIIPPSS